MKHYEQAEKNDIKKETISQLEMQLNSVVKQVPKMALLNKIQEELNGLKTKSQLGIFLSGKVSYKQLIEKREKTKNDRGNIDQINEAIKNVESYIKEFKGIEMTEAALRKRLEAGEYKKLLEQAESLLAKSVEMRLILTEEQSKQV